MKRLLPLLATLLAAAAYAGLPPTQAWRLTFPNAYSGTIDVDASGYGYMQYINGPSGHWLVHLEKIGATAGVYFDKSVDYTSSHGAGGVYVAPAVAGKQYVYEVITQTSSNPQSITIYKYDTSGTAQWAAPFVYSASGPFPLGVAGMFQDASGNLMLAMRGITSQTMFLDMLTLDTTGATTSEQTNLNIGPTTAFYSTTLNAWVASGYDMPTLSPLNSGRWGVYDPTTGSEGALHDFADGSISGFSSDGESFLLNQLPGNAFSVAHNSVNGGLGGTTYSTIAKVFDASGTLLFQYPASTPWGANTLEITNGGTTAPYLMVSQISGGSLGTPNPRVIDALDGSGHLLWEHRHQPADVLFPWTDGFFTYWYDTSHSIGYLEHADTAGTFDFGKQYVQGTSTSATTFGAFRSFQNSFYVVNNMWTSASTVSLVLDRFITGIAMQSVTSASSSVQGGHQLQVLINLNAPAPAGGVSIGVSTNSNKLLLPNNTQGQFVTVPAGASFVAVTLNAQAVATNTPVRVLGMQFGVRRFVDVTVTP